MISKTCPICGKIFWSGSGMQVSCSKSCAAIYREQKHRENKEFKKKYCIESYKTVGDEKKTYITKLESVESKNKDLIDMVKEAEKLGMSYGRYSAMMEEKGN